MSSLRSAGSAFDSQRYLEPWYWFAIDPALRHRPLLLATWLLLVGCDHVERDRYVRTVGASPIEQVSLSLAAGATLYVETRHPSEGAVATLHLWDVDAGAEVALAQATTLLSFATSTRLEYRNRSALVRSYRLIVRARDDAHRGAIDLYRDGALWLQHAAVGGTRLQMASGPDVTYQVAAVPGSPHGARLLALDGSEHLIALDERSGPTNLPRLRGNASVRSLVLASTERPGSFRLYANDAFDHDGDGLGRRLERALGTCDHPNQHGCRGSALAKFYQRVGTRDSDRDGIDDAAEVFGLGAPALDFPRFGADPRHKDAFVEIDHQARLDDLGFDERDLSEIAALFAQGDARALRNPDGAAGIHVHFDAGFAPNDPRHLGLFGDFGGSGVSHASEYRSARKLDFTPSRSGYFRYAFSTRTGRGQTTRDAFTVNRDLARVTIFAHELGHALGLKHHGHDAWGDANCKPNYLSIMNYLYQAQYAVGFSRHARRDLNPSAVFERGAARGLDARLLRDAPLEFDVHGQDVDWNHDGLISDEAVRAPLTWGTFKSCNASEVGLTVLADHEVAAVSPVLLNEANARDALWLDTRGRVWWRRGIGDGDQVSWSAPRQLGDEADLRFIAGLGLGHERMALAVVRSDGAISVYELQVGPDGLQPSATVELGAARTDRAPSLTRGAIAESRYGATRGLRVVYRDAGADGRLMQIAPPSPSSPRALLDGSGQPLPAADAPSVIDLPTGETCGVFTDSESSMRVFCYDPNGDRWIDVSQRAFDVGLGPRTSGPVGMAFHRYRDASGAPIAGDPSRGALYLSFTEPPASNAPYPDNPNYLRSEWLSAAHGAREQLSLRWRGRVISEWTTLAPGTGVALAEDDRRPGLEALMVVRDDAHHGHRLEFLPHADGEFDRDLGGGDDFEVMERGICMGIRSEAECGDASTGAY